MLQAALAALRFAPLQIPYGHRTGGGENGEHRQNA
jgi:hypothetical protein